LINELVKRRAALDRGSELFRSGEQFGALCVVRSGSFKTVATDPQGEVQVLGFHLPQGDSWARRDQRRAAPVQRRGA